LIPPRFCGFPRTKSHGCGPPRSAVNAELLRPPPHREQTRWHQDRNRIPIQKLRTRCPRTTRIRRLASRTTNLNGQQFSAPAPILEVGRNVLVTHAGKSRYQAWAAALSSPRSANFTPLRGVGIWTPGVSPRRVTATAYRIRDSDRDLFPELTNPNFTAG
jgi:hypothetical protein